MRMLKILMFISLLAIMIAGCTELTLNVTGDNNISVTKDNNGTHIEVNRTGAM